MDQLEKFVIQNRDEFDVAVPSLKAWAAIDREMEKRSSKKVRLWRHFSVAAAVLTLLIAGGIMGVYFTSSPAQGEAATLADIAPEYAELEQHYHNQINQKIQQLASYQHDLYVQEDLRQLDETFLELRQELQVAAPGSEAQIVQAMLHNYQTKVDILERVLEKIQSTNQNTLKTEDDEIVSL